MSQLTYEASVYSRDVKYRNFNGVEKEVTLYFALDPIKLMRLISGFEIKTDSKSGNPAKRGKPVEVSEDLQLKFVSDLAEAAAGTPSDDGESWESFADFNDTIAGKAFLTRLASSDKDRREFSERVILDPFRAFVQFAKDDETNSPKEVKQFEDMLVQMERLFVGTPNQDETLEERKARLAAELESLGDE